MREEKSKSVMVFRTIPSCGQTKVITAMKDVWLIFGSAKYFCHE